MSKGANIRRDPPALRSSIVPEHWIHGELLNVQRFSDGTYTVMRLSDDPRNPKTQKLQFTDGMTCQNFVSRWYAPVLRNAHGG